MSFTDNGQLAQHLGFRERCIQAACSAAVSIANETPNDDPRVAALRKTLATNTLNDPLGHVERFTRILLTNPTVAASGLAATDGDLAFTVSSVWDALAGV